MKKISLILLMCVTTLIVIVPQAWADLTPLLPDAFSQYGLGTNTPCFGGFDPKYPPSISDDITCGTMHAGIHNVGIGPATIISNTLLLNFGSTSAAASSVATGHNESAGADAKLFMYFEVVGPACSPASAPCMVPLTITATYSGTISGSGEYIGSYFDSLWISDYDANTTGVFNDTFAADSRFGGTSGSTTILHAVSVPLFTTFGLRLQANAAAHGTVATTAMVDPTIEIDPSFASAGSYQILFSPNIVPPVGVPEPSSLALCGLALACTLRFVGRRSYRC